MDGQATEQVVVEVLEGQSFKRSEWYVQCVNQILYTRTKAKVCHGLQNGFHATSPTNQTFL